MSWLKKIAQLSQATSPLDDLIKMVNLIALNQPDDNGELIDLTFAQNRLQQALAQGINLDTVCQHINELAAGVNPVQPDASARPKMQALAAAINCPWEPVNPPMAQQPDSNMMDPSMMPQMGQQEQPMEMPSAEIE